MYRSILVPVKLSHVPQSAELMEKALTTAAGSDATLKVVTIVPEIPNNLKVLPEDSLPELERFVAPFRARGVKIESAVRTGTAHRAIPRAADEFGCDLIVMNSHNPRIRDYFIGSIAAHVVMHSECDVLVVRQGR
ncbi:universal stress protein [Roseinatronobacter sp.]